MSGARVLVTGASGMIGRAAAKWLDAGGFDVVAVGHEAVTAPYMVAWQLGSPLGDALCDVAAVVHLAARVHVRGRGFADAAAFEAANSRTALRLAEEAREHGVRRFVFMSSIGVLGGASQRPLHEDDAIQPLNAYARSKARAEVMLREFSERSGMELVILRPPAVIGPGMKGNVRSILNAVRRGLPLPFAAISNQRQFVGVWNLADAIMLAVSSPAAAGQTFHVADPEHVSTPELCRMAGGALNVKARLWRLPPGLLRAALQGVGRKSLAEGLTGDLLIDTRRIRQTLAWEPRLSLQQSLNETARAG